LFKIKKILLEDVIGYRQISVDCYKGVETGDSRIVFPSSG